MKCHYEILGLPRDVEFDELKKTYRKLALQWHPDKNPENIEEATAQFRLIQQAYDVLSDPQERAWYDRHREVILKGGIDDDFKDNCVDVFPYFTVSCFSGYDDSEKGFYSIYREVFDKIAAEDMEFLLEKSTDIEIPKFGDSTSSYEEVVHPFYAHWLSYCTLRSYVWVETYDIREAPNRRVVRLMEKENKKLRDQAKKKRNEEVRTLVEFVRKRDKRVQAYRKVLEEKAALNAKKTAENRKKQLQERQKMLEGYQESEWSSMSTLEADLKEIEATLDKQFESDDIDKTTDDDDDGLYCVACEKAFRNQKGMENHIKSKKHKENFELLKTLMEEEEISLQKNVDCASDDSNSRMINNESNEDTDNNFELQSNQFEFDKHNDSESAEMSNDEYYTKNKRKKKSKVQEIIDDVVSMENDEILNSKETSTDDQRTSITEQELTSEKDSNKNAPVKLKGKKAKEARRKLKEEKSKIDTSNLNEGETSLFCSTCGNKFSSRNKLFAHLKSSGHSVYLPSSNKTDEKVKKKGKSR